MHELSIANNIIDIALEEIARRGLDVIESIGVRIGALTCVCPEALSFGFEAATIDTPLALTKLIIEQVPIKGKCKSCNSELAVKEFVFLCPSCGSRDLEITQGEELEIAYMQVRYESVS
ncbi:MAG: hydrogenase maturation nickel metallochaperone HypA [candidate division Zixibacteria bacterium]|nr:hydrogenase maturation nickel metallochaperone HypA [candidate division Zixibacteria bacterium]MBU1469890.1 hydrogenase maturation nickel metallochaperone HypA [candidate division Zixibacteria bacterium]MBU2623985.1 hydrogenase maturation nickel metallochaperone HypA [candidate division Zixibacteria bacterium]